MVFLVVGIGQRSLRAASIAPAPLQRKSLIFQAAFNFPMLFPSNRLNRIKISGHKLGS
jgi:hypothetical protein